MMHKKQKLILVKLDKQNGQKYSELAKGYEYEDKFSYHINQLVEHEYIYKNEGRYYLTTKGLKFTGEFDKKSLEDREKQHILIGIVCEYKNYYLLTNSHIYDGRVIYRFPGGRPNLGESFIETCKRCLPGQTGISREQFEYKTVVHRTSFNTKKEVVFDNLFLIFHVSFNKEEFETSKKLFPDSWFAKEEISKLENVAFEVEECLFKEKVRDFSEFTFTF